MVSNMTLVKIAAIGGIATCTMGLAWRFKVNENICRSEQYKEAMFALRHHKGAVSLLGEPIKDHMLDIGDVERNYTKDYSSHYEIPVKGPNNSGVLHFWASRDKLEDKFTVDRLELALDGDDSKRLRIRGSMDQETGINIT